MIFNVTRSKKIGTNISKNERGIWKLNLKEYAKYKDRSDKEISKEIKKSARLRGLGVII